LFRMALQQKVFVNFATKIWWAHTRFCLWVHINNEFMKRTHDAIVEKDIFWHTTLPTLNQGWILALASILERPYYNMRTKQQPRLCLDYIAEQLDDPELLRLINEGGLHHKTAIESIKRARLFIAHNPVDEVQNLQIEAVGNLFDDLEKITISVGQSIGYGYFTNSLYNDTDKKTHISAQGVFEKLYDNHTSKNARACASTG
jgi:hypothetical protein